MMNIEGVVRAAPAALPATTTGMLKKSLRQIGAASASLGITTTAAAVDNATSSYHFGGGGAYRLLAQEGGGFDAAKWVRSTRELQQKLSNNENQQRQWQQQQQQQQQLKGGLDVGEYYSSGATDDLDTYCRETMQHITQTAIRQAMEVAEESCYSVIQKQLKEDYEHDKKRVLMNFMGYHYPSDSTHNLPKYTYVEQQPATNNNNMQQEQQHIVLPDSPRRHAIIIQRWHDKQQQQQQQQKQELITLIEDFHELSNDLVRKEAHSSNATKYITYANAWELVQTIIVNNNNNNRAMGCLQHLCQHYQKFITGKVKDAIATRRIGVTSSYSSFAQLVDLYVKHFVLSNEYKNNNKNPNVWPQIYYCLRCGNIAAALETATLPQQNDQQQTAPEPEVIDMLNQLVHALKNKHNNHNNKQSTISSILGGVNAAVIPTSLRNKITDLYQRMKHRSTITTQQQPEPTSSNTYKVACLQLLANTFSPSSTNSSEQQQDADHISNTITNNPVVETIEDYLFTYLWMASNNNKELENLGHLLKHWGPSYFEPTTTTTMSKTSPSGGWAYAMPLILAQQFQTALTYLANSNNITGSNDSNIGLLQATHLAIGLFNAGIPLQDVSSKSQQQQANDDDDSMFLTSILVSYCKTVLYNHPEIALEYLVLIPSKTIAKQQIQRLLLEASDKDMLCHALSQHFSDGQKKMIFEGTSREAQSSSTKAIFLDLAGNYSGLLSLFNEELSNHLIDDNKDRKFWNDAAIKFHKEHFSSSSKVVQVLESEGTFTTIGRTFQLLLNLMVFFDKCKLGEWQHAFHIIDGLGLIPRNDVDISLKVDVFNQELDSTIKNNMSYILLACTESLCQQHVILKEQQQQLLANNYNNNQQQQQQQLMTVQHNLTELRQRARTLVTFSGLIHLNHNNNVPDVKARIARMEAYMI